MKTKAFTVVEMTIVLLITGMLLVIAVKSASMLEAVRIRAAVAKVQKLQAGFNAILASYQSADHERVLTRSLDIAGAYDKEQFIEHEILAAKDFEVYKQPDKYWDFMTCFAGDDNTSAHDIVNDFTGTEVCIVAETANNSHVGENFICHLETMLDDKEYWRNNIRANITPTATPDPCINVGENTANVNILLQ